jgi:hypothetical protein
MKKRQFKPKTVKLNLKKDLFLDEDITVWFWENPSREVVFTLIDVLNSNTKGLDPIEAQDLNKRYFDCASLMLIDCDIEGVDFSTPESTEAAFQDKRLPWGIFHQAILAYMGKLVDEYKVLKNALRRVGVLSDSGNDNEQKESE